MSGLRKLRRLLAASAGYSLIELLITVVILSTVIGALTVLFVQASNSEVDMNRRFQAQLTVRQALDKMRREIHCSSGITPTGATNSISVTLPGTIPPPSTVSNSGKPVEPRAVPLRSTSLKGTGPPRELTRDLTAVTRMGRSSSSGVSTPRTSDGCWIACAPRDRSRRRRSCRGMAVESRRV